MTEDVDKPVLPDFLVTDGEWGEVCARLYDEFEGALKRPPRLKIKGKLIVFDGRKLDDDKEEGFWHLVSRGKGEDRNFDPARARRLCWVRPMVQGDIPDVVKFEYSDGKNNKIYIWLVDDDYVIVLAEKQSVVLLVTAFYIDAPWLRSDLERRRAKGRDL